MRVATARPRNFDTRAAGVLVACFVCQAGLGCGYVFAAVLKHVVADFEWSRTAFSMATVPLLLAMGVSAPLVGRAVERYGARAVLTAAALLLAAALAAFARVDSLASFYAASFALGVALTGLGDVAVGAVAARWAGRRRGLALALVFCGSNAGGALVPLFSETVAAQTSWRLSLIHI